jgi:hypothetical protein
MRMIGLVNANVDCVGSEEKLGAAAAVDSAYRQKNSNAPRAAIKDKLRGRMRSLLTLVWVVAQKQNFIVTFVGCRRTLVNAECN